MCSLRSGYTCSDSHSLTDASMLTSLHMLTVFTLTLRNRVTYPYTSTYIWTLLPYHTQDHTDIYLHKQYTQTFSLTHPCHHFYTYTKKHIVTHVQRFSQTHESHSLTHAPVHSTILLYTYTLTYFHTHALIYLHTYTCSCTHTFQYSLIHALPPSCLHIPTCTHSQMYIYAGTYRNLLTCILTKYIHLYSLPHANTHT